MKSFRIRTETKTELAQGILGLLLGVGLFWALHYFHIAAIVWRIVAVLVGALFVGYLCRGQLCRTLRMKYPKARWIGLLALGIVVINFGVVARIVVPGAEEGAFTLAFILPAGACIATFVLVNRKDPDVTK